MDFLDPFGTGNGGAAPSPAKQPSGMNYGGAAARVRAQSNNGGSGNAASSNNPFSSFGQANQRTQRQAQKHATAGLGNLSMLDPLAKQTGMAVREQDAKERRRNKPIGRPMSIGEMPGVSRAQPSGSSPVLDEFDPLSGGGGGRASSGSSGNQASFDSGGFDAFSSQPAAQTQFDHARSQQPTMNVSQAFGSVGMQQQQQQQQQQMAQQQRQAQMAGLGRQVLNMGISNQGATSDPFGAGSGGNAGFFDDDSFGMAGDNDFGQGGDFGDDDFGDGGGFDLDKAAAEADAKEEKKRRKAEKKRKKEEAARAAQEQADREFAMKLHAEENARAGSSSANSSGDNADPDSRLPRGWTRDHRGNIQGRLFERVTTKIIGHKWSPRSVMITANSITLRKVEADKRGQQRSFQITEYTTVGAAYINPEQAHAMIDRVYQFKIIEKEPWGQEPKQLAKLGSVDLKVIKFLRKEIADRVASKY
eukprot:g1596.t1